VAAVRHEFLFIILEYRSLSEAFFTSQLNEDEENPLHFYGSSNEKMKKTCFSGPRSWLATRRGEGDLCLGYSVVSAATASHFIPTQLCWLAHHSCLSNHVLTSFSVI
jgi:hypothetical protein